MTNPRQNLSILTLDSTKWPFSLSTSSNFTNLTHEQSCQVAYSFRSHRRFLFMSLVNVVLSLLSLYIIWCLMQSKRMRRIWNIVGWDLRVSFPWIYNEVLNGIFEVLMEFQFYSTNIFSSLHPSAFYPTQLLRLTLSFYMLLKQ